MNLWGWMYVRLIRSYGTDIQRANHHQQAASIDSHSFVSLLCSLLFVAH
jgi:hypothetical protein